jgi:hypothetical protein
MPGFKVRRKPKPSPVVEPVAEAEPVEPEVESDNESMASYYSGDDDYIDEVLTEVKELNIAEPSRTRPPYRAPAPAVQPHRVKFADQQPIPAETRRYQTPRSHMNDPYRRQPAMDHPPVVRPTRRGRAKMLYGSHYGPGGHMIPTQTKARMLYTHCFG